MLFSKLLSHSAQLKRFVRHATKRVDNVKRIIKGAKARPKLHRDSAATAEQPSMPQASRRLAGAASCMHFYEAIHPSDLENLAHATGRVLQNQLLSALAEC